MTKRINLRCLAMWSLTATIATIVLLFAAQTEVAAQEKAKVGDRVENAPAYNSKGTIMEVGTGDREGCYRVLSDATKAGDPDHKGHWVCTYGQADILYIIDANGKRVRDVNAPKSKQAETKNEKPERDQSGRESTTPPNNATNENGKTAQTPPECSGQLLLNLKTKGRKPSAELFRQVIKADYDEEGTKRDPAKMRSIKSLVMGKSYYWRPGSDLQMLGQAKTVYPVRVKRTDCTEYTSRWLITEYEETTYSCYVDETRLGEWTCSGGSGKFKNRDVLKQ